MNMFYIQKQKNMVVTVEIRNDFPSKISVEQ